MEASKVGMRIQEARKAKGMTQAELSQIVDITPKYLSNIECGAKVPRLETFIAIANALEVDANTLLADVLSVSGTIIGSEISKKLAALSPREQRRIERLFNIMIEDEINHIK